jgi:hypothetical protein
MKVCPKDRSGSRCDIPVIQRGYMDEFLHELPVGGPCRFSSPPSRGPLFAGGSQSLLPSFFVSVWTESGKRRFTCSAHLVPESSDPAYQVSATHSPLQILLCFAFFIPSNGSDNGNAPFRPFHSLHLATNTANHRAPSVELTPLFRGKW